MKKYLILVIIVSILILSACNKQGDAFSEYVSKDDIINYSLDGNVNTDRLTKFVDNVSKGVKDQIKIVRHTTEGDPIITQLYFNGKDIQIALDTSQDKFGGADKDKIINNTINGGNQLKDDLLKYLKDNGIKF